MERRRAVERVAVLVKRKGQDVDSALLDYPRKLGHKQIDSRDCDDPEGLDIFLGNMVVITEATKAMGLSTKADIFITHPTTMDMDGLILKHKVTPVNIFIQRQGELFFEHWGFY